MHDVSKASPERLPLGARLSLAGSKLMNSRGIYLGRRSTRIHVAIYRLTRGKMGARLPGFPNVPIVLVDHIGSKTGTRRTTPLMYDEVDGVIAVAASKAGEPKNPAWFNNLMAHPETTVQTGPEKRRVRARVATDDERAYWWPRLVAKYPGYEFFQERAKDRQIPIVLLEPLK